MYIVVTYASLAAAGLPVIQCIAEARGYLDQC